MITSALFCSFLLTDVLVWLSKLNCREDVCMLLSTQWIGHFRSTAVMITLAVVFSELLVGSDSSEVPEVPTLALCLLTLVAAWCCWSIEECVAACCRDCWLLLSQFTSRSKLLLLLTLNLRNNVYVSIKSSLQCLNWWIPFLYNQLVLIESDNFVIYQWLVCKERLQRFKTFHYYYYYCYYYYYYCYYYFVRTMQGIRNENLFFSNVKNGADWHCCHTSPLLLLLTLSLFFHMKFWQK